MGNAFHSAAERKSLAFGLLSCLILAAQAFKQVGHRGWSPNRFLTKSKKGLVSFAVESSTRPPIVYDAANKRISQHSGAFLPLQGESTAFILPGDSSVELTEEFLGMKVVTKKWISYCKSINKSYSGKAYDIQDVITACMKPNTMVHIEDPGDAPVPDTTFISESELVRLFQSKHANEELTEEHYQIALLYEDTKHEFDQQTTEKPYFTMIDQFQSIDVPIEAFYTGKPSNLVDDSAVPSPTARVFEGELHSDTVLFVTQQVSKSVHLPFDCLLNVSLCRNWSGCGTYARKSSGDFHLTNLMKLWLFYSLTVPMIWKISILLMALETLLKLATKNMILIR